MNLFTPKRYPFTVTLHLDGRHPYLKETHLDFASQDVTVRVAAKNWNDAEKVALSVEGLPRQFARGSDAGSEGLGYPGREVTLQRQQVLRSQVRDVTGQRCLGL